ncbi:hypothetical protein [Methylobacterium brachiatum]|uniref:hypothetical protein n=1 Tax=Methylobacterium brachiatum TaxID=269660 RepID=UPI000EFD195B|nr:hypothetical protein [Methylobacterium brachiatum]AYO85356.1 hypothetical protein EBB05_26110 [Methylobacterium brachiatum]
MSSPAAITALPGLLRVTREAVEAYAPAGPVVALKWTLLGLLLAAEVTAEQIVALAPVAAVAAGSDHAGIRQVHTPLAENAEPMVPRRTGRDERLPGKRPHP